VHSASPVAATGSSQPPHVGGIIKQMAEHRPSPTTLQVFLCHSSGDKPHVRTLYQRLVMDGVDPWLDEQKLIPGQLWREEIKRAVRSADVVIVCLSSESVNKEGFVQREIKYALDTAEEKPPGTIFIIPVRLEECKVPEQLAEFQWVNLFEENGYDQMFHALRIRAQSLGLTLSEKELKAAPRAEQDAVKELIRRELLNPQFKWRTFTSVARVAGLDEQKAADVLRKMELDGEVVFARSPNNRLVGLKERVG
jgi:hypothetical protein